MTNQLPIIPVSHSRLQMYRQCALRFYFYHVYEPRKHRLKDSGNEAMERGTMLHKQMERASYNHSHRLPKELQHLMPFLAQMRKGHLEASNVKQPGDKFSAKAEVEHALTYDLQPTQWMSNNVWVRVKMDVELIMGPRAIIVDWKSGKPRPNREQHDLYGGTTFSAHPAVMDVAVMYVWMDHPGEEPDITTYNRRDLEEIWRPTYEESHNVQTSLANVSWPATENFFCISCGATPAICQYAKTDDEKAAYQERQEKKRRKADGG